MGKNPISFAEIKAWKELTGVDLSSWESSTMRSLSMDYVVESNRTDVNDAAPTMQETLKDKDSENFIIAQKEATVMLQKKLRGN